MLISGREAEFRLEVAGLTRRQARRVLAVGLAGRPRITRAVGWFDEARVGALAAWPVADEALVDQACPHGLFIARRDVQADADREEQIAALNEGWGFSELTSVWLRTRIQRHGYFPFAATVCGFVTAGADLMDVAEGAGATRCLSLSSPGRWFESLTGHRIEAGPGRPWVIRGWQLYAGRVGESGHQLRPFRQESA